MFNLVLKILFYISLCLADSSQLLAEQNKKDYAVISDTTNKNSLTDFTIIACERFEIEESNFNESKFCNCYKKTSNSNYIPNIIDELYFTPNIINLCCFRKTHLYLIFLKIII